MCSGPRPSPEHHQSYAMSTCLNGSTEGRYEKTRRKARQKESRYSELKLKPSVPCSAGGWWAKGDTRDQNEGKDEGLKNNNTTCTVVYNKAKGQKEV